jgi:hypothetical protein
MNARILSTATLAFAIGLTSTANALNIHLTGDGWGGWVIGLFTVAENPTDGSTQYALSDNGSGNAMDFMMTLPDGTAVDGADVTMRMISADTIGAVGGPELGLTNWKLWITGDGWGVHVIWDSLASPLPLSNIGSSGQDGVEYAATGLNLPLTWTYEEEGEEPVLFDTNFESFEMTFPVPEPSSALLVGVGFIAAACRRRR